MAKDNRGFLNRVSALYNLWGLLPSTWQTAAVGAVSALTAYFGFKTGGIFYALIGSVFVFAVGMFGLFFTLLVFRNIGVFGKLSIREIGVESFAPISQGNFFKEIKAMTMFFGVQNNGARDIHFKLVRAHLSIVNQTNQEAKISDLKNIVPSGLPQRVMFATIEDIKFQKIDLSRLGKSPLVGKVEIEMSYGPSEYMPYVLYYAADIQFGVNGIHQHKGKWQITLHPAVLIKRYDHKKMHIS